MRFLRSLNVPASETQLGLALAASTLLTAVLLCAIVWQSHIIIDQRDLIRLLANWKSIG